MSSEDRFRQNSLNLLTLSLNALDKIEFISGKFLDESTYQSNTLYKISNAVKKENKQISISDRSINLIGKAFTKSVDSIGRHFDGLTDSIDMLTSVYSMGNNRLIASMASTNMKPLELSTGLIELNAPVNDTFDEMLFNALKYMDGTMVKVGNLVSQSIIGTSKHINDSILNSANRISDSIIDFHKSFILSLSKQTDDGFMAISEKIGGLTSNVSDTIKMIGNRNEIGLFERMRESLMERKNDSKEDVRFIELGKIMTSIRDTLVTMRTISMEFQKYLFARLTSAQMELAKQTMALEAIQFTLANQPVQTVTNNSASTKKETDYKSTAANIFLIAGSIVAFGLALNLIKNVPAVNILAFTASLYIFVQLFEKLVAIKEFNEKNVAKIAASLVMMSMAMPFIGFFLSKIPIIPFEKYASIAFISLAALPLAYSFSKMLSVFKDNNITLKSIALAALAFPMMTMGLVMSAYALLLLPEQFISMNQIGQIFLFGLAIMPLAVIFGALSMLKMSLKDVLVVSAMLPLMSLGLVASVFILTELMDYEKIKLPSLTFMGLFSANFLMLGVLTAILGMVPLTMMATGIGNLLMIAGGLMLVSHILSYANTEFFQEGGILDMMARSMKVIIYEIGTAFLMLLNDALPIIGRALDYLASFAEKFIIALLPFNTFITNFAISIGIIVESLTPLLMSAFTGIVNVVNIAAIVLVSAFNPLKDIIVNVIQGAVTALVSFVDLFKTLINTEPERILKAAGAIGVLALSLGGLVAVIAGASIAGLAGTLVDGATAVVEYLTGVEGMKDPIAIIISLADRQEDIKNMSESIAKVVMNLDTLSKMYLIEDNAMQRLLWMLDDHFEDGYEESSMYFAGMAMANINSQLEVMLAYQDGLSMIADTFDRIGISMGVFKDNINAIEIEKLTLVNDIFTNSIKFLEENDGNSLSAVSEEISSGISNAIDKATDLIFAKNEEQDNPNAGITMSDLIAFKESMIKDLMLMNDSNLQAMNTLANRILNGTYAIRDIND